MSTSDKICKDGAYVDVCEVNDMLQNMITADNDVSVCSNCGKEDGDITNICNKCKMVKYCNAACKKKHRSKHKKKCEEHIRLATEHAAELHEKELFKQPPPLEDCPICMLRMPTLQSGRKYKTCCGKFICSGCCYAPVYDNQGNKVDNQKCPFCRTPFPASEVEVIERERKRMEAGDAIVHNHGIYYEKGMYGFTQDYDKALQLYHRAGKLGLSKAYGSIGNAYKNGYGVEIDKNKAVYYYELAAMGGDVTARHNLGNIEGCEGNFDRALKHFSFAVRDGDSGSLKMIKTLYSKGYATKEEYTKALQLYQAYLGDIKSVQRDKATAAHERYKYY